LSVLPVLIRTVTIKHALSMCGLSCIVRLAYTTLTTYRPRAVVMAVTHPLAVVDGPIGVLVLCLLLAVVVAYSGYFSALFGSLLVVLILIATLNQFLFGLLNAKRTNQSLPFTVDVDVRHVIPRSSTFFTILTVAKVSGHRIST